MKIRSNQAGFSFLDLILWIRDSVDWSTLTRTKNKNPPDTPNNPNVQVNLGAQSSIGRWNLVPRMRSKQGNDNLIFGVLFWKLLKHLMSSRNRNRIPGVIKRSASTAFLLPASTPDSNDKKFKEHFGTAQTSW